MHLRAAFTVAIGAVGLMGSAHGYLIDPDSVSPPTYMMFQNSSLLPGKFCN